MYVIVFGQDLSYLVRFLAVMSGSWLFGQDLTGPWLFDWDLSYLVRILAN